MPIYKGQTKIVKLYKGSTQIVNRYKGTNLIYSSSRLPSAFQEVEYIESTGTQYIDSGLLPQALDHIIFKAKANSSNVAGMIFGSYRQGGYGIQNFQDNIRIYSAADWLITDIPITNDFILETTDTSTIINTVNIYANHTVRSETRTYYLFAGNFANVAYILSSGCRFYYCKIARSDGTLVRNFVPCYRKADNVAGLYDLVNGVFYTNAGTGTFIVGGNV